MKVKLIIFLTIITSHALGKDNHETINGYTGEIADPCRYTSLIYILCILFILLLLFTAIYIFMKKKKKPAIVLFVLAILLACSLKVFTIPCFYNEIHPVGPIDKMFLE